MPNRREFLQTSAAVSALAIDGLVPPSAAALGRARSAVPLHKAIFDDRYAEAQRFGAILAAHGVAARALEDGDITRFWYDELDLLWRRERAAIAGMTQFGPLFALEQLAAERGLHVAMRIEHRVESDGTLTHRVTAPDETIALLEERPPAAGLEWPSVGALAACRCTDSSCRTVTLRLPGAKPELRPAAATQTETPSVIHYYTPRAVQQGYGDALDGPLYSWVIAPQTPASRG